MAAIVAMAAMCGSHGFQKKGTCFLYMAAMATIAAMATDIVMIS